MLMVTAMDSEKVMDSEKLKAMVKAQETAREWGLVRVLECWLDFADQQAL